MLCLGVSVRLGTCGVLLCLLWVLIKILGSEAIEIMGRALEDPRQGRRVTGPCRELAHFDIFD